MGIFNSKSQAGVLPGHPLARASDAMNATTDISATDIGLPTSTFSQNVTNSGLSIDKSGLTFSNSIFSTQTFPQIFNNVDQSCTTGFVVLTLFLVSFVTLAGLWINGMSFLTVTSSKIPILTTDLYIMSATVSDFLACLLVYPVPLIVIIFDYSSTPGGIRALQWYGFAFPFFGVVTITSLAALAVDRYLVVAHHSYLTQVDTGKIKNIVAVWLLAFMISVPRVGSILNYPQQNTTTYDKCFIYLPDAVSEEGLLYPLIFLLFGVCLPMTIMSISYIKIYILVRNVVLRIRINRISAWSQGCGARNQVEDVKTERRIAIKMILMVLIYLFSWLPFPLCEFASSAMQYHLPFQISLFCSVFAKACVIYNPLLNIVFSQKYRKTFKNLLTCQQCRSVNFNSVLPILLINPDFGLQDCSSNSRMITPFWLKQQIDYVRPSYLPKLKSPPGATHLQVPAERKLSVIGLNGGVFNNLSVPSLHSHGFLGILDTISEERSHISDSPMLNSREKGLTVEYFVTPSTPLSTSRRSSNVSLNQPSNQSDEELPRVE